MPKPHIMRISGWLPVSFSIYKSLYDDSRSWLVCSSKEDVFYCCMKLVADWLNDGAKLTNKEIIKKLNVYLKREYESKIRDEAKMNICIDFIRDSLIIFNDTIKQERQNTIASVLS